MSKVNKLYNHSDRFVELEFQNIYNFLTAGGKTGTRGPRGPQGYPGSSEVLSLKQWILQSELDGGGEYEFDETLPAGSLILDIYGVIPSEDYQWTNYMQDPPNDTLEVEHSFEINTTSYTPLVEATTEYTTDTGICIRVWPLATHYTTPAEWMGAFNIVEQALTFKCDTCEIGSSEPGRLFICLNYILMPELPTLSS